MIVSETNIVEKNIQDLSTKPKDSPEIKGVRKVGKRRAKTINDLRAYMTEMAEQENERKGDVAGLLMVRPA